MVDRLNVGGAIREMRKERNLTLSQLDRLAGVKRNHTGVLERRGFAGIHLLTFMKYAAAFDVDFNTFIATIQEHSK